jgi:hypothetical protein
MHIGTRPVPMGGIIFADCASALLAFPGAEGFGRNAVGGRTGSVYHVTTLAYVLASPLIHLFAYLTNSSSRDSSTGSFRDAVSSSNRIVVFDVGGTINITDRVVVPSNVYIAGQTAPGDASAFRINGRILISGCSYIQTCRESPYMAMACLSPMQTIPLCATSVCAWERGAIRAKVSKYYYYVTIALTWSLRWHHHR